MVLFLSPSKNIFSPFQPFYPKQSLCFDSEIFTQQRLNCMKNIMTFILALILLSSCRKVGDDLNIQDDINAGCIERKIVPVTQHSISNLNIQLVNSLFLKNGIDNSKLRYYQYTNDSFQTYFPPYTKFDQKLVRADQYFNGLRLFEHSVVYNFKEDVFDFANGIVNENIMLDTNPKQTLTRLRKLYVSDLEQFNPKGLSYKDSCLKAEFGYYELNSGSGNNKKIWVKAWKVTPQNTDYPQGYYQDENGSRIAYSDGIIFFR